jgi:hypothetical protein
MDINKYIGIYSDEDVLSVVNKILELLDESINSSSSKAVRDYLSRLSVYRGLLISIEFQLRRNLDDKKDMALKDNIMTAKSSELREIQLDSFTQEEKDSYEIIKKLREEMNNKSLLCSSILKSVDLYRVNEHES